MKIKTITIIFFICLAVFLLKYQGFPVGGTHEQLPLIYQDKNSTYFTNDFYVNSVSSFNIRGGFIKLVNLADIPIGNYEVTYIMLHFICIFIFSIGFYKIMFLLTKNKKLSLFSLIFPLIFSISKIAMTNHFVITNFISPSKIAWTIAIWSIYFYLKEKHILSFLLLGLVSIFHVLISMQIFGILFLSLFFRRKYKLILSSLAYLPLFLISVILLFFKSMNNKIIDSQKIFYILAEFRAPHHFLPFSWSFTSWLFFIGFLILFLIIFYKFSKIEKKYKKIFECLLVAIFIYYIVGIIFVEIIPIVFFMKLQLFRITEFLNIIEFIFIGEFFYNYFYGRLKKSIKIISILLVIFLIGIYSMSNPLFERNHYEKEDVELFNFIKANTPEDTILLTLPYHGFFRIGTMRAIVIDKNSLPFSEPKLVEWYERMMDVTKNATDGSRDTLKKGYNSLNESDVLNLQIKYGCSYAIFENSKELDFPIFYENEKYVVYSLTNLTLNKH